MRTKYLEEAKALAANPDDPEYKSWTHIRKYGLTKGKTAPVSRTREDGKKEEA
jgi:hypothetical protein